MKVLTHQKRVMKTDERSAFDDHNDDMVLRLYLVLKRTGI